MSNTDLPDGSQHMTSSQNHATYPPAPQTHSLPPLPRVPGELDIADWLEAGIYFSDPALDYKCRHSARKLVQAGPVFRNRDGKRVWFSDLDWDVQCGMITTMVRPIEDKEEFMRSMGTTCPATYDEPDTEPEEERTDANMIPQLDGNQGMRSTPRMPPLSDTQKRTDGSGPVTSKLVKSDSDHIHGLRKDSLRTTDGTQAPATDTKPQARTNRPGHGNISKTSFHASAIEAARRPAVPHDELIYDEVRGLIVRRVTGIKGHWHPSTTRVSQSEELFRTLHKARVAVMQPRFRVLGTLAATLREEDALLRMGTGRQGRKLG